MPTEQDIRETCDLLTGTFPGRGGDPSPLLAPHPAEQQRVFQPLDGPEDRRRDQRGGDLDHDPGNPLRDRHGTRPDLPVQPPLADGGSSRPGDLPKQRRSAEGALRPRPERDLHPPLQEEDYLGRPLYTPPEILRSNLAGVILRMLALESGRYRRLPLHRPPRPEEHPGRDRDPPGDSAPSNRRTRMNRGVRPIPGA